MFDKKCVKAVDVLIEKELKRTSSLFEDTSTAKEALTEKIFECDIELGKMKGAYLTLSNKRTEKDGHNNYDFMYICARNLAIEAIQVAAMCQKAIDSEIEK